MTGYRCSAKPVLWQVLANKPKCGYITDSDRGNDWESNFDSSSGRVMGERRLSST